MFALLAILSAQNFSGHIVKINNQTSLVRFKVDFVNYKYLPKYAHVKVFSPYNKKDQCLAVVKGKSPYYLLLKIIRFRECANVIPLTIGSYLEMSSSDLNDNLVIGEEVMEILAKKEIALKGLLEQSKLDIEKFDKQLAIINNKYNILRDQLYAQWDKEITELEESKNLKKKYLENVDLRLLQTQYKMEKYRLDEDDELDEWSIDPQWYYKK